LSRPDLRSTSIALLLRSITFLIVTHVRIAFGAKDNPVETDIQSEGEAERAAVDESACFSQWLQQLILRSKASRTFADIKA